jgi:hypothetical protein
MKSLRTLATGRPRPKDIESVEDLKNGLVNPGSESRISDPEHSSKESARLATIPEGVAFGVEKTRSSKPKAINSVEDLRGGLVERGTEIENSGQTKERLSQKSDRGAVTEKDAYWDALRQKSRDKIRELETMMKLAEKPEEIGLMQELLERAHAKHQESFGNEA